MPTAWRRSATAPGLPVVNLCARIGRTVAVADVLEARALDDDTLGDVRELSERGVRAVLATPIVAQDRLLGVLAFHRSARGRVARRPRSPSRRRSPARLRSRSTRPGCFATATAGSPSSRRC